MICPMKKTFHILSIAAVTAFVLTMTGCKDLLLLTDHTYEDTVHEGYEIKIRPVSEVFI